MFDCFEIVEIETSIVTEEEMNEELKAIKETKKQKKSNLLNKFKLNGGML